MLFLAEGTLHKPVDEAEHTVAAAWLGPMVDAGFLQSGWLDTAGSRVVMVLSAADRREVDERIADLPVVRDGTVTFTLTPVRALRFS